jgi:hypothetical protein
MKRIIWLFIFLLVTFNQAFATQRAITNVDVPNKLGDLRTSINTRLGAAQLNFNELFTGPPTAWPTVTLSGTSPIGVNATTGAIFLTPWASQSALEAWLGWTFTGGSSYTLPTASGSTLGGIKIGSGLSVDGSGVVTASGSSAYTTAPTYSDAACTAGQYALSGGYRYDCQSSGVWYKTAMTSWSNPTPSTPTLSSATIPSAGTSVSLVFSSSVSVGSGGNGGWTLNTPTDAMTYASGSGSTTLVYNLASTITSANTPTISYTQPGNGVEATTGGADVATISGASVTNNSTQTGGATDMLSGVSWSSGTYSDSKVSIVKFGSSGTASIASNTLTMDVGGWEGTQFTVKNQTNGSVIRVSYTLGSNTAQWGFSDANHISSFSYSNTTFQNSAYVDITNDGAGDTVFQIRQTSGTGAGTITGLTIIQQ